ncbi:MAG TPA: phosphonate ABC transporter permease [Clostridiales bacterium]|nr:phosphonate ABC transporter permease [Clostridiales bacterium]
MELDKMKFWQVKNFYEKPNDFFREKHMKSYIGLAAILVSSYFAASLIGFDLILIFTNFTKAVNRFLDLYIPPNFTEINNLIEAMWVTLLLCITAGTIGTFLAYVAALGMSKTTGKITFLRIILRALSTFLRNVPASIWAIVLLMAFWFGEFLALLVMTIGTFGFNARLFSDMIDETNKQSLEALDSVGANYWQIVFQGIIPETLPTSISWSLFSVETNIRSSTIIGMLAGGGIGHLIGIYRHFRKFDQLAAAVIFVVISILAFDQLSVQIRKRIL